jgi:hypothetical protein
MLFPLGTIIVPVRLLHCANLRKIRATSARDGGELVAEFFKKYINVTLLHSGYFVCEL